MSRSLILAAIMTCATVVSAQPGSSNADHDDDDFARSLNEKIDMFLERVSRGISEGDIDEVFFADTLDRKPRRTLRTAELESKAYAHSYSGDIVIDATEVISGNVIVKAGDLEVHGTVEGDVLVIGGTLFVIGDGVVTGNARVINGDIVKSDGGRIEGYEDQSSSSTASYRTKRHGFRSFRTTFDAPWMIERTNLDNVLLRYNRVEGVFLGLGSEKRYYWDGRRTWSAFGGLGWGFKSHTWRYSAGLARQFALTDDGSHLIELGLEGYSLTDSKDHWRITTNENSAAAFFIHEDFLDYFERRGLTGHVAWYTQGPVVRTEVRVGYLADAYRSLDQRTDWALFGGNKTFRPNPEIDNGTMRSVVASAGMTTLDRAGTGPEGWSLHVTGEVGRGMTGSHFSFNQAVADLRRFQPIGRHDNLNIRLRAGTSEGVLPRQKTFELGGIGSLHGYKYKAFSGNRMILINTEYILDGDFLDELDFWPLGIFSGLTFIFMSDAGYVTTVPSTEPATSGFGSLRLGDFAHNFGFGISNRSGSFRLAYAWRTDIRADGTIIFRYKRPF